ncbi:MAG: YdjY domain-containing protein [Desulfocapsaceae bacterium]|nr:YdjY domain-containing protein [Desulfocapsaceae bacterium]
MKMLMPMIALLLLLPTRSAFSETPPLPTKDTPIVCDKAARTVSFLAQVNGKYFYQPTRHFAVSASGSNGDKAILRGLVSAIDFHNALLEIGAVAGENMSPENKEVTHVQGSAFTVRVSWEGADRPYGIDEVVIDSNKKPIQMKFGGNLANAKKMNTGCLLCLDSCPVGIVSNSQYTYGAIEKRGEVEMRGNKAVLPPDGTTVIVTLQLL